MRGSETKLTRSSSEGCHNLELRRWVYELDPINDSVVATMASGYKKANVAVDVEMVWLQNSRKAPFLTASGIFDKCNVVSPLLRGSLVPEGHCAEFYLKNGDVLFLCNIEHGCYNDRDGYAKRRHEGLT